MFAPIRVGAVSYLNAKPLYYRLEEFAPEIGSRWITRAFWPIGSLPGRSTWRLIPSIEYFRGAASGYEILPGFAIAAHGRCSER